MSMLKLKQSIKRITQEIYDTYTRKDILKECLSQLGIDKFIIHGYYKRNIIDVDGNIIQIKIMRIKVDNKTHAILLSPIVPFLTCSYHDIISITVDNVVLDDCPISISMEEFILNKFKNVNKNYESICSTIIQPQFIEYNHIE